MREFRFLVYGFMICALLGVNPASAARRCQPLKSELKQLLAVERFAWAATSVNENGIVVMYFLRDDGAFVILGVDDKDNACELLKGNDFHNIIEKGA